MNLSVVAEGVETDEQTGGREPANYNNIKEKQTNETE